MKWYDLGELFNFSLVCEHIYIYADLFDVVQVYFEPTSFSGRPAGSSGVKGGISSISAKETLFS